MIGNALRLLARAVLGAAVTIEASSITILATAEALLTLLGSGLVKDLSAIKASTMKRIVAAGDLAEAEARKKMAEAIQAENDSLHARRRLRSAAARARKPERPKDPWGFTQPEDDPGPYAYELANAIGLSRENPEYTGIGVQREREDDREFRKMMQSASEGTAEKRAAMLDEYLKSLKAAATRLATNRSEEVTGESQTSESVAQAEAVANAKVLLHDALAILKERGGSLTVAPDELRAALHAQAKWLREHQKERFLDEHPLKAARRRLAALRKENVDKKSG